MAIERGLFIAGGWRTSKRRLEVSNPYDKSLVGTTFLATAAQLEEATKRAVLAFEHTRRLPSYRRAGALRQLLELFRQREAEFVRLIVQEAGKPLSNAQPKRTAQQTDRGNLDRKNRMSYLLTTLPITGRF